MKAIMRLFLGLAVMACLLGLGGASSVQSDLITRIYKPPYLQIATEDNRKWTPAVAYSPAHDVYLVVWEVIQLNQHHDIYGRLVNPAGQMSPEFLVSSGANNSKQADVAYDSVLDSFLVVWAYDTFGDDSDYDIYARFIPWSGPSPSFPAFSMDQGRESTTKPKLAYASAGNQFLIVWKVEGDAPAIAGGIFTYNKNLPPGTLNNISISSGPELRDFPAVTYNAWENDFVVAWDEDVGRDGQDLDIYAIRLTAAGAPKGAGEFPVAFLTTNEQHPTVAACYFSDEVLFAWQQQVNPTNPDENIFGRIMNGYNGIMDQSYGLAGTTLPQRYPRLSCNPEGNEFLLVWHDEYAQPYPRWGVWAELIHPGLIVEPAFEVVRPSDIADRLYPAVAFGKGKALVVWQHGRDDSSGYLDIWGQMVWFNPYNTYLPTVRR